MEGAWELRLTLSISIRRRSAVSLKCLMLTFFPSSSPVMCSLLVELAEEQSPA
jgi:hypothetical protein